MSTKHIVAALVAEAARLLSLKSAVADEDRDAWLLAFDDETMFDIEYDAHRDRIVLAGGIRDVADVDRFAIYEMLLQFNYLWTDTGGVRMALDGSPGQVVMLYDLPAEGLGPSELCAVLEGLAGMQRSWREILEAAAWAQTTDRQDIGLDLHAAARQLVFHL